jgi:hypothetical protein
MKSGNLNFLVPSEPLQACNGTALPVYLYIQEMEWGDMDWIDLAQDREKCQALANAVMNI